MTKAIIGLSKVHLQLWVVVAVQVHHHRVAYAVGGLIPVKLDVRYGRLHHRSSSVRGIYERRGGSRDRDD